MRSRNNITPKNSTRAILAGKDNTLSASAKEFIILGDGNIVGDGKNIALIGSSGCIIGSDCSNVTLINSSGCIVSAGLKNVSLINTFNQTIESSDTYYLNNALQLPTVSGGVLANVYEVRVVIPSADVLLLNTNPYELVPAPSTGYIRVLSAVGKLDYNSTNYISNDVVIKPISSVNGYQWIFRNTLMQRGNSELMQSDYDNGISGEFYPQFVSGDSIVAQALVSDPFNGDSDLIIYLTYQIIQE